MTTKNKNDSFIDLVIKRQVLLERLKSGQVADFAKEIKKVERLIKSTLSNLDDEINALPRYKLNTLLNELRADQGKLFKVATQAFLANLTDIAALYASQEVLDLKKSIDLRGTSLKAFTKKDIFSKVIKRPLSTDGELLEPWLKNFTNKEIARTTNIIRMGHAQGKTNKELVTQLIGTKNRGYKNGVLEVTRRNASTVVRTSVQHVASAARQEVWEANKEVIDKYEFLATLDSKTSNICRTLDGQVFDFGKGPIPPLHPNCRSTTLPVLNSKYEFLSKGRTRSAEDGPTSAKTTYYDWLKRQNKSVQVQVLGKTRAELFINGGMSAERFARLQFDKNFEPLTLDEMRAIEPEAFKKAGL